MSSAAGLVRLLALRSVSPWAPRVVGEELGLTEDELAFYDALEANESAVKVLGEPTHTLIARELVQAVRNSVTIDWTLRENVRAQLRVIVKRILRNCLPAGQARESHAPGTGAGRGSV